MRFIRLIAICAALLGALATPARAQVNVGIGLSMPGVSIGINIPAYPRMVAVPGYPVYYAPAVHANLFFYDGLYWVFIGDDWYVSSWYNGPWRVVAPMYVPYYVLRVPVRYYSAPPAYFRPWRVDGPPRWGQHWGPQWEREHRDWDRWDRRSAPRPAPLPDYQRRYSGRSYPQAGLQPDLHDRNYRYQPRSDTAREFYRQQPGERRERQWQGAPREREERQPPRMREEQRGQQMQPAPREMAQPRPERYEPPRQAREPREAREVREPRGGWAGQPQQVMQEPRGQEPRGQGGRGKERDKREEREERGRGHDR